MVAVGASLVALAIGALAEGTRTPEFGITLRTAPQGFWYVFAVFFPAVTGFTAGIGMSGDLKDPRHSIPRGTLAAVATGTAVYLLVPVLLAVTTRVSPEELAVPGVVWTSIAVFGPWLVFPGLWGAILSSAFGSVLGGPRVLQALAADGLAPSFLARLSQTGQPTIATWIQGAIALAAVALGGLNAVAQFVTILFLTLYVTINLASALESLVGDPSYRPTIRVPWFVSLLGSIGRHRGDVPDQPVGLPGGGRARERALPLPPAAGHAQAVGRRARRAWVALARWALLKLRHHEQDPRNWRPHILLFAGDPGKRAGLVRLASWFNQDRGIVTVCRLVVGDLDKLREVDQMRDEMDRELEEAGVVAFPEVDVVSDFETGVLDVAQANGIAGLHSNTVMFGWPRRKERLESQLRIMRAMSHARKNTIIARLNWAHEPGSEKRIDIWWGGLQNNGDLMLLLAYLLRLNPEWRDARISCARSRATRRSASSSSRGSPSCFRRPASAPKPRSSSSRPISASPRSSTASAPTPTSSSSGFRSPKPAESRPTPSASSSSPKASTPASSSARPGEFAGRLV